MNIPEKHREVAHAWIDGADVETSASGENNWWRVEEPEFLEDRYYRVKSKPKVKKWRWVYFDNDGHNYFCTRLHYPEEDKAFLGLLQKIDSTLIEEEA